MLLFLFQRMIYTGHEKAHGWKSVCVGLPNGLYGLTTDMEPGPTHDAEISRLGGIFLLLCIIAL
jgi:hypothetical protein